MTNKEKLLCASRSEVPYVTVICMLNSSDCPDQVRFRLILLWTRVIPHAIIFETKSINISDYTMTLSSTSDGDIAVNLEAYRIASLNGVMDGFIPEANEAIVLLGKGDDQNLLALLTFYPGRMKLDIVEGNVYGLPEDTVIWFDR